MTHLLTGIFLVITVMLQSGIASRITLFSGTTDLILLFLVALGLQNRIKHIWLWTLIAGMIISLMSAMPFFVPLFGYLALTAITQLLQKRVWQTPLLAMLVAVFFGTLIQHALYILALIITETPISWIDSINFVTLPSLLLNMLLAIPAYTVVHEIALIIKPIGATQ